MKKTFTLLAFAATLGFGGNSFAQIVYTQDFESTTGTALPTGWAQVSTSSPGWQTGTALGSEPANADFPVPAHTRYACINDDAGGASGASSDNSNDLLKTAAFSTVGITGTFLKFDQYYNAQTYQGIAESETLEASTDGGTTWTVVATVGGNPALDWETQYVDLGAYDNMASVMIGWRYKDGGGWLYGSAIDNIVVYKQPALDLGALTLALPTYVQTNASTPITGYLGNYGSATITSLNLNYSVNGGAPVTSNATGISVASFTAYNYTSGTPWVPATAGVYTIKVWADNLNGGADANNANDTISATVNVIDSLQPKMVMIEEFTQGSCDPCANAAPNVDSVYANNYNNVILLRYHVNFPGRDCMDTVTLNPFVQAMLTYYNVSGVPDAQVDGQYVYPGAGSLTSDVLHAAVAVGSPVKINVTASYDIASNTYTAHADIKSFAAFPAGLVARAALSIDSIRYVANQSTESIPQFLFPEVAENMFPGPNGTAMTAFTAGQTQSIDLSWVKNHAWGSDFAHWAYDSSTGGKVIVWLQDNTTENVYQAAYAVVSVTEGVNAVKGNNGSIDVYPNPARNSAIVSLNLKSEADVKMEVYNIAGQVVFNMPAEKRSAGTSTNNIDVSKFAAGDYFVRIAIGSEVLTKKLTIAK